MMITELNLKKIAGISLVELMVAIAVGSLLSLGLIDVLINSNQAYRIQNALMRVQEEGQFATEILIKDIRDTDFWGCINNLDEINNHLNPLGSGYTEALMGYTTALEGQQAVSGGNLINGSDTITIRAAENIGSGTQVQPPYGPSNASDINVPNGSDVRAGDIVLVSDCLQGDIFQVTNANAQSTGALAHEAGIASPGNTTSALSKVYFGDAFVFLPYTRTYSIRTNNEGNPGLYVTDADGTQELVEGVENMLILYGEDLNNNGSADRYVREDSVADMNDVVSVRINLVVASLENNVTGQVTPYVFNGQTITPNDRRLRRVYTRTIVLRNRAEQ